MTTSSERINNMFANSSTWSSKEAELKGRAAIHASQARHTSFYWEILRECLWEWQGFWNQRSETCTMKSSSAQHYLQYHTDNHRYTVCYNMLQWNRVAMATMGNFNCSTWKVWYRQVNRYSAANARAFAGSTVSQEDLEKEREASQKRKAAEQNELAQLLEDCSRLW